MVTPDDDITVPAPVKEKSTGFQKSLTLFAVIGVIGLGACGLASHKENLALIGLLLIVVSLFGLVITAAAMAIASVLKATEKK